MVESECCGDTLRHTLQYTSTCFGTLQVTATRPHNTIHCKTPQHTARALAWAWENTTLCDTLRHTSKLLTGRDYNTLKHTATHCKSASCRMHAEHTNAAVVIYLFIHFRHRLHSTDVHCNPMQHTSAHCSAHCNAHCNT